MGDDEDEPSDRDDKRSSSLSDLAARLGGDKRTDDASKRESGGSLSELAESLDEQRAADHSPDAADEDLSEWDFVSQQADGPDSAEPLDPKTEAVLELTGDASNVLLSGPSGCPADQSLCGRLMASRSGAPVNLLVITVTETPSQRLSILENYLDAPVGQTAVVDVRNYNREVNYEQYDGPVDIRTVSSPQDLRRIGIVTSKILTEWEETPAETTLCFHSLSDLLNLNEDRQRVFRFLHVLRGRVQSAGGRAHYHLDPDQHQNEAVSTFESLFDTVVEFDEDGSVSLL